MYYSLVIIIIIYAIIVISILYILGASLKVRKRSSTLIISTFLTFASY